jgi:lipopolysaccharide export system permease protein
MKILDRYILGRFTAILLFALIAFISIFIIVDLIEKLDDLLKQKVAFFIIVKLYLFSLPYIIVLTLPVAMLLSSLFSVGNMARQNELVAMKASGLSLYRILAPLFVFGFLVSLFAWGFGEFVLPGASERYNYLRDEYLEKHREAWRKRILNPILRDDAGKLLSMRDFHTAQKNGNLVSIRRFDENENLIGRIDARRIEWQDSVWMLYDGYERIFKQGEEIAVPFAKRKFNKTSIKPEDFDQLLKNPEEMSFKELKAFIEEVKRNGGDADRWLVDLYLKTAIPLANFIIILFGAPLSSPKRRGGMATGFGVSLVICFVYFGIVKTSQTMGHSGLLPPLLAAWVANIIFAIAGIFVLMRTSK